MAEGSRRGSPSPDPAPAWTSYLSHYATVNSIPEGFQNGTLEDWLVLFSGIIQSSSRPVCVAWLDNKLSERSSDVKEALVTLILQKLEGHSTVLQKIKRLGKEDLFAELLCFLKFGSLRKDCYYNSCLFVSQRISILEDLVIAIADSIASIYLELISVDGNLSNELNNLPKYSGVNVSQVA